MRKFFATGVWVEEHLPQWVTSIMIMVHVGLAAAIIVGGESRFTLPSYQPLIDYTGGRVWLWGLGIGASAVLMSVPFRWTNIVGLWLGMCWHIVWMACFSIAVLHYPGAAATPLPAYGGFALICSALLTARVIDKSGG